MQKYSLKYKVIIVFILIGATCVFVYYLSPSIFQHIAMRFSHISDKKYECKQPLVLNNPIPRPPFSTTPVPEGLSTPSCDRMATTKEGYSYVKDEILLVLNQNVDNSDRIIKSIADDTNATILGSILETRLYQLQYNVGSYEELLKIKEQLRQHPDVKTAGFSWAGKLNM